MMIGLGEVQMRKRFLAALLILTLMLGVCLPAEADYDRPYYIDVDITNQVVTVYNTSDGSVARQMICSTGVHNSTPKGTYYLPHMWRTTGYDRVERSEWYWFDVYTCYAKWATRIYADILFHSVIYDDKNTLNKKSVNMLGSKASHGCIRLRVEDAKFIAKNCLSGTRVRIFESGELNEILRMRLKYSSFTGEDGMTYEEFFPTSTDGLGLGDEGEAVSDVQSRLQALGYYKGSVNGLYDMDTVNAVRQLQTNLGVYASGTVERELEQIIFSDDVPISSEMADLTEGQSGPVVRKFQTALKTLGFYDEEIDGVYDLGVIESVKAFQKACGIPVDGKATMEMQHLVYFQLNKIETTLGTDQFAMEVVEEDTLMATSSNKQQRLNVRAKASAKSELLGQLAAGEEVMMFGTVEDWAKILYKGKIAYVLRKSLTTHTGKNSYLQYSANGKSVKIGSSWQELEDGTNVSAMQELKDYYEKHKNFDYLGEQEEHYVTVDTGDDNVTLNLRDDASSEGMVLAQLPNGTSLRMLSRGDEWTSVSYNDQIGYLMSRYLDFDAEVDVSALQAVDAYEDEEIVTVISPDASGKANIYAEPDENSAVVKSLEINTQLSILSLSEDTGWALVSDGSAQGYIQGKNLSFSTGAA